MDECVAVAEAEAAAETEAVTEADQSIHDQSILDPSIKSDLRRLNMKNIFFRAKVKQTCVYRRSRNFLMKTS